MVNKDARWQTSWLAEIGGGGLQEKKKQKKKKSTREGESLEQIYESQPKDETKPSWAAANSIDKETRRLQGSRRGEAPRHKQITRNARVRSLLSHWHTYKHTINPRTLMQMVRLSHSQSNICSHGLLKNK